MPRHRCATTARTLGPVTVGEVAGTGHRAAPNAGVWSEERRTITIGIALAVTVVAFEALSVATILPIVSRHLGDLRLYGWVFSAFLLSSLLGIVVAGRLADGGGSSAP